MHRRFLLGGLAAVLPLLASDLAVGGADAEPVQVPFECRARSSNDGCERRVRCPAGAAVEQATAACNLEHGAVTEAQLERVPRGELMVVRRSDHPEQGSCWVQETTLGEGARTIEDIGGRHYVNVGCQEHDKNGGDCHIRGVLSCR